MKLTVGKVHLEIDLAGGIAAVAVLLAVILWRKGVVEVLSSTARKLAPPS
jgi:hypothetical protein